MAALVGAAAPEIYFVSSGSEANNYRENGWRYREERRILIVKAHKGRQAYNQGQAINSNGEQRGIEHPNIPFIALLCLRQPLAHDEP